MKILLCSVIYPQSSKYTDSFFKSIDLQTNQNFDVLLVNDGYENINCLNSRYIVEPARGTILDNRIQTIDYAVNNKYDVILWLDFDDIMLPNRIQFIEDNYENEDILVHDLKIIDENENIIGESFTDFDKNKSIAFDNVKFYNFVGFGNMAIKVSALKNIAKPAREIQAVDWWMTCCLLLNGCTAKYYSEALVLYRQHESNLSGVMNTTPEVLERKQRIVSAHYEQLFKKFPELKIKDPELYNYFMKLKSVKIKESCKFKFWWQDVYQAINDASQLA